MGLPFLWMISSSLKEQGYIFIYPPQWLPEPVRWQNYIDLFNAMPFLLFFYNSLKIAFLTTVGQLLTCSLAAYVFARFQFWGRDTLFAILLATLMVPFQVTMIPVFITMHRINLLDTHLALWGPAFLGGAYGTFLLRQFFLTLPPELEDAARVDGCSRFGIWWRIFLPLSKPALATLGIFVFMGQWNDLLGPVLYLSTKAKMTLTIGLAMLFHQWGATPWNLVMAGAVVTVLPILLIYIFGQKYFVQGIVTTGLKF
ncbi:MAG: carbohydrate ABC transporter permease [Caldilinea sp. CFX5]|nr:carbohydrate ABC transporter permease [Caldilinea sp. CFX5]